MAYFRDLTPYSYAPAEPSDATARNVGWLTLGINFPTAPSDAQFADRLWQYCKVSIVRTRGLHKCELCCSHEANIAARNNEELLLGSAEIRVISTQGQIY